MSTALTCNFNERSLHAVVQRVMDMHLMNDAIFIGQSGGMYAVHDAHGLDTWGEDNIQLYTKEQFEEKFGEDFKSGKMTTLDQLQSDFDAIDRNRIDGPVTSNVWHEKHDAMKYRLEQIQEDMQEQGIDPSIKLECNIKPEGLH